MLTNGVLTFINTTGFSGVHAGMQSGVNAQSPAGVDLRPESEQSSFVSTLYDHAMTAEISHVKATGCGFTTSYCV